MKLRYVPSLAALQLAAGAIALALLAGGSVHAKRLRYPPARRAAAALRPAPARLLTPSPRSHVPAPVANFKISAGASNAARSGSLFDFGDYTGLAFSHGTFYPIWADNSAALGNNPDLPTFDLGTAAVAVNGVTPTVGANVNVSRMADSQSKAAVAINPTNPLNLVAAANLEAGTGVFKSFSIDGGATWTSAVIADGADGLPDACCDVSVAFDSFGNCFLSYVGFPPAGGSTTEVALSTDGGQTFSALATLGLGAAGSRDVEQPTLVTGPGPSGAGSVWVTWTDFNAGGVTGEAVVAAGARVNGLGAVNAFSAPQVAPGSAFGSFGDIVVGPAGQVMVVYQDNIPSEGPSQLIINVDADGLGPGGFAGAVTVANTNVGGFDSIPAQEARFIDAEAGLAWDRSGGAHNGRVYLVYTDERPTNENDNTEIFVRYSDNNGAAWSSGIRVNDDAGSRSQFLPRIALDQTTGNVAVTWYDCRNDGGTGSAIDSDGRANTDAEFWGTILPVPLGVVQFSSAAYAASESAGTLTVTVTRTGSTAGPASVNYAVTGGTAARPDDFTLADGTLNFADGQASRDLAIAVAADRLLEDDETIALALSNPSLATLGATAAATVTITDDRAVPAPGGLAAAATGPGTITLSWTDNCDNEDGFQVDRKQGNGAFAPLPAAAAGATSYPDMAVTVGTPYTYRVRAARGGRLSANSGEASATITTVQFSAADFAGAESAGSASITVTRTGDTTGAASVVLTPSAGSAAAGADFDATPIGVNFAASETSRNVGLPLTRDRLLEGSETIHLSLGSPTGAGVVTGPPAAAVVTVADDTAAPRPTDLSLSASSPTTVDLAWTDNCDNEDGFQVERRESPSGTFGVVGTVGPNATAFTDTTVVAGTRYTYRVRAFRGALVSQYSGEATTTLTVVQFSAAAYSATEGAGSVVITVTRSGDTGGASEVTATTADGTAAAPADYTAVNQVLSFGVGETSRTFNVAIHADTLLEPGETVNLALATTDANVVFGEHDTAIVTIADNPLPPSPTGLEATVLTATEVRLRWADNCGNETAYLIERRIGAGAFAPLAAAAPGATEHVDAAAAADVSYEYRVRAVAGDIHSAYTGAAAATIPSGGRARISPRRLNFGNVRQGAARLKTVRITNRGRGPLAGVVGALPAPFRVVSGEGPYLLAPRRSLRVTVEYAPTQVGPSQATLTITSTDPPRPRTNVPSAGRGR